jgi:predicted AlkP superfamily pyrophosphatase or phosphodiesterase
MLGTRHWLWVCLFVIGMGLVVLFTPAPASDDGPDQPTKPRLVVLVVFDQLRGDYLTRWQKEFSKEGFGRLQREGAWFQNCHYPYAYTLTAPGHASMVTGCTPARHGIVANRWYDRASGEEVSAVGSERHQLVTSLGPARLVPGPAPVRRRATSVGEALLLDDRRPKGKVVSLSIKDRAAVLLAALRASICAWFNTTIGQFVSSTYYGDRLPTWMNEFNRSRPADRWFKKSWDRFRPDLDYNRLAGPDDVLAEGVGIKQGRTFPHALTGGSPKIGRAYYEAMTCSPFGNELLLDLARRAIDAEKLGQRAGATDLLCLSFSSNDLVGHTWGPDSQEVLDVTLRSDRIVRELLAHLDSRVGKGRYLVVLSADHGICPLPEVARARGMDAGRVPPQLLTSRSETFLNETFNKGDEALPFLEAVSGLSIYLNRGTLRQQNLEQSKVEPALAAWLTKQPGVKAAYTATQLSAGPLKDDPLGESVRQSYDKERSGDVMVVLRPNYLLSPPITSPKLDAYRTTHGTPYPYDTHVPLLVFGAGVRSGVRSDRVMPLAVAAILAHGLGVPPPAAAEAAVPKGLFQAE